MRANVRFSKAIKAMAQFGFPEETVKTILQDLLQKGKRNWKLIEKDNYHMLVDAIIENDEKREEEGKELQKLSEDESEDNQPLTRSKLKRKTAQSSALAPERNFQDRSPPHNQHKRDYSSRELASYKDVGVMDADVWNLDNKKGHGSHKSFSQLKPIMETKLLVSGSFENEAGGTSLGYPSLKRRRLAPKERIHSVDSEDINFISDVFPSPEVNSPGPLALILQGRQCGFNKILDKNCSHSSGTNLLEMINVDDEFDAIPSLPCQEGVVIKGKDTHMEHEMGNAIVDQVFVSSISDSTFNPYRIANRLDLTHCKYDLNLKVISNGESNEVNDEPSNGSSTINPLMIIRSENQYFVEDITRGEEEKEISLINEVNSVKMPTFSYIPKSIPYCNARVKVLPEHILEINGCSSCLGDCLSSGKPCLCAQKYARGFAYGTGGVVKDGFIDNCISINNKSPQPKPSLCEVCPPKRCEVCPPKRLTGKCKGHVIRNFIKECWYKCGCSKTCGNRTVQRGISAKLQVFMTSEGKGWGLRTLEDLPRGAFICEYVGEILTTMELVERNMKNMDSQQAYSVLLDADWRSKGGFEDEGPLCLDGKSYGNVSRFINHRCHDANMIEIPVEVETPDHYYYHVAFFTTRKVKAMEELTWDYGIEFGDDSKAQNAFQCCCGSDFCRGKKMVKTSDICATETSSDRLEKHCAIQYHRRRSRAIVLVD